MNTLHRLIPEVVLKQYFDNEHNSSDAQAIAFVETGVAGLKFNHDAATFAANWGANPWPIKRILSVIATREGRIIQLHDGQNFTYAGLQAIHRLSQLR